MALQSVAVPGQRVEEKKPDVWDRIAQGLQIANGGLGIAVNWEQFNKLRKEKAVLDRQEKGQFTEAEYAKMGVTNLRPIDQRSTEEQVKEGSYLTPPASNVMGPNLQPPGRVNPPKHRVNVYKDGQSIPMEGIRGEDQDKLVAEMGKYFDDYKNDSSVAVYRQSENNFNNVLNGLNAGNPAGDLLALANVQRLYSPGIARAADGSAIANADSIWETIDKRIKEYMGGPKQVLFPKERANLKRLAEQAMAFYSGQVDKTNQMFTYKAGTAGINPKELGLVDPKSWERTLQSISDAQRNKKALKTIPLGKAAQTSALSKEPIAETPESGVTLTKPPQVKQEHWDSLDDNYKLRLMQQLSR